MFRGIPIGIAFAALFVANGLLIGWRQAYDVMLAITSPAETSHPPLAWLLSIAGWLVVPVVAGAVAGHVVTAAVAGHRATPVSRLFTEDDDG